MELIRSVGPVGLQFSSNLEMKVVSHYIFKYFSVLHSNCLFLEIIFLYVGPIDIFHLTEVLFFFIIFVSVFFISDSFYCEVSKVTDFLMQPNLFLIQLSLFFILNIIFFYLLNFLLDIVCLLFLYYIHNFSFVLENKMFINVSIFK